MMIEGSGSRAGSGSIPLTSGSGSGGPKTCRSGGSGSGSATLPNSNPLGATFSQRSSGDVLYMYIFTDVWLCLVS
jgi:hypothetical protein